VAFELGVDRTFDYLLPESLADQVAEGSRVRVPFGTGDRSRVGHVVGFPRKPAVEQVKTVLGLDDQRTALPGELMPLARWMSRYYVCPMGMVLSAMVPSAVKRDAGAQRVRTAVLKAAGEGAGKLSEKQTRVVELLAAAEGELPLASLLEAASVGRAVVAGLKRRGVLALEDRREFAAATPEELHVAPEMPFELNADQAKALARIGEALTPPRFEVILLHGITGSGKTEVYLQAISDVVAAGRQAIVLVPEISLTPQTVRRFAARVPPEAGLAVLHSGLRPAQRHAYWERIRRGEAQVIVGARSAVFAPCNRLGLIILDEEHEGTFKQDTAPRYHARDVGIKRAQLAGIPVILGTATPSLESYHNATVAGRFTYLTLPARVHNRPLPAVHVVDMREQFRRRRGSHGLCERLEIELAETLARKEQAICLLNRRGFATFVFCPFCKWDLRCPDCDVPETYHRWGDIAVCHYCGRRDTVPEKCPMCSLPLERIGRGTQRVEEELREKFPEARVARMDSDTMASAEAYARVLHAFGGGHIDVLLGTQMIAKGLDFPNVTLVGVLAADTALHQPDFRAAERTFQLIAQVAGRAGRAEKPGRVILQTFMPDAPAIRFAVRHDYAAFAAEELGHRRLLTYPPYGRLVRLLVRGRDEARVLAAAAAMGEALVTAIAATGADVQMLAPTDPPHRRIAGQVRQHALLKAESPVELHKALAHFRRHFAPPSGVHLLIDVDPWTIT
jgi:primosomal protein N' (replication factor Y)